MSNISEIIQINISRETAAVSREAFNIPLFIATHTAFSSRSRVYFDMKGVATDFDSSANVYKAAQRYFGQTRKPPKIVIGRRQVDSVSGSISDVVSNTIYSLTINGVTVQATSDDNPTATKIVSSLRSQFTAAAISGVGMTDNLNGTFTVQVSEPGSAWSVKASPKITLVNAGATESWPDSIDAVEAENSEWYALSIESHVDTDVMAVADAIEARDKIFGVSTRSPDIPTSWATDIATALKESGHQRTFILFSENDESEFPECAWIGDQLPETPGANTWMFKTLSLVSPSKLNATEKGFCFSKNCNIYDSIGGQNITRQGRMVGGEFIDVIIFIDWLKTRIAEGIYSSLVNSKKIPYTQAGLTILQSVIYSVLQEGVTSGGLADNPKPNVYVPNVSTVAKNLKASRTVEDIKFDGVLQGAFHFVKIDGTVTV